MVDRVELSKDFSDIIEKYIHDFNYDNGNLLSTPKEMRIVLFDDTITCTADVGHSATIEVSKTDSNFTVVFYVFSPISMESFFYYPDSPKSPKKEEQLFADAVRASREKDRAKQTEAWKAIRDYGNNNKDRASFTEFMVEFKPTQEKP